LKIFLNDRFIIGLILVNSLLVFTIGFEIDTWIFPYLLLFDSVITGLFLIEAGVKIRHFGFNIYIKDSWNKLDFILVVLAIPSLLEYLLPNDLIDLNFLMALRILRIFKFFRFIRFIPKVERILEGIYRAARASILILIGFLIVNFTIGLLSCFMFREISPEYFSNPIESIYSIFKIFTVEGWYEIPDSLTSSVDNAWVIQLIRLFFIVVLFIGGIFGLSLVNSIFVDAMVSDNNRELEEKIKSLEEKIDVLIQQSISQSNKE
jgi:voltage-gated sodium channel